MTYSRLTIARNTGNIARNVARASRRAFWTAAWSERGLIGNISDTDASSASVSAMILRNRSDRFRPDVAMRAWTDTRQSTMAAVGTGRSSGEVARSRLGSIIGLTMHSARPLGEPATGSVVKDTPNYHGLWVGVITSQREGAV